MKLQRSLFPWFLMALFAMLVLAVILFLPSWAAESFGQPASNLGAGQRYNYSLKLLLESQALTQPCHPDAPEQIFVVRQGETVDSIAVRLEQAGIICDAQVFRDYLVWSGLDRTIQAGTYRLSPALTGMQVARALQDATPTEVTFFVYAGWRIEEIAEAIPASGLQIAPQDFVAAASLPLHPPAFLPAGASAEGFLAPGEYTLPRTTDAAQLVSVLLQEFTFGLTPELEQGFTAQGLSVYQAVILASIVEREAVFDEEMPLIASVFYNRLRIGMNLQSDPTVQYALGFTGDTWWKNPLTLSDLEVDSPFNTYLYPGLPPAPISNPSLAALEAVAFPAQTNYYYFSARCDGSGYHNFAETFEEQLANLCR
ncbi:MAG: endolytic transglycosylase MltG [Anaerolineales bacterium]